MGLGPKDELKYAIYQDHPSYLRLEQGGWPRSRRLAAMLEWLTDQPVLLLADTVHDWRPGDRAHVKDLYVHALGWCLRRAANHVEFDLRAPAGPHAVLVDMPNGVHRVSDDNRTWLLRSLGNSLATAAFALYQSRYLDPEPFPSGDGSALASLGFQPELHAAHAKHSDLLQVADLVAGCVSDLCAARLQHGPADASTWREDHFQLIAGQFRRHTDGRVISFGLDAFDPDGADPQLRDYLKAWWQRRVADAPALRPAATRRGCGRMRQAIFASLRRGGAVNAATAATAAARRLRPGGRRPAGRHGAGAARRTFRLRQACSAAGIR